MACCARRRGGLLERGAGHGLARADGEDYVRLDANARDLAIEVQRVEHESRVHLDLESDDVHAEADRLVALGPAGCGGSTAGGCHRLAVSRARTHWFAGSDHARAKAHPSAHEPDTASGVTTAPSGRPQPSADQARTSPNTTNMCVR